MEGLLTSRNEDISLQNLSVRLWEQLIHFHVMGPMYSLFPWVGAVPNLSNLTMAICSHYDSILVSISLLGDTSDMTSNCLAQILARKTKNPPKNKTPPKQVFVSYSLHIQTATSHCS
ncbi:proteasome assembly chaperone 4-like [Trichosurus vulpecula]|uniref:proteasome assembly chaperone 4-like n=1 Tax=Trichosurus vulpecula TaxID=9337 RepID=UPI00186B3EEE|nr:proteasome assembly chaperone 4-like [Trichosurus vulpecula]